jgi:hypothetical protein
VTYCTFGASVGGFTPGRCVPIGIRRVGCSPSDASTGEGSGVSFIVERTRVGVRIVNFEEANGSA